MNKLDQLRLFISDWVNGPNTEAILQALADQFTKQDSLTLAVNAQLYKSTAENVYLDKQFGNIGIVRPQDLGISDMAYRQLGISINQSKLVIASIHDILSTFYGNEAVTASTMSGQPAPYSFAAGDDLTFALENGTPLTLTLVGDEFENIQNASAGEIADIITRFIRANGLNGFAKVYINQDTLEEYVQIFGGAKGPFSFVTILGGKIQSQLEFQNMRATDLTINDTVWEITRNVGSTHRFRWVSGSAPLLDKVLPGDSLLLYGPQFATAGFEGTFEVTAVVPPSNTISYTAGYFEISIIGSSPLASSVPDIAAPINSPGVTYTITLTQNSYEDLKFFFPKKATPYSQVRYSLAWEAKENILKIYLPATTNVVERDLFGGAHLHLRYLQDELNGSFGSVSDNDLKVEVISLRSFRYKAAGSDVSGMGGTIVWDSNTLDIESIVRENGFVNVICTQDHGLPYIVDSYGRLLTDKIVVVQTVVEQDDQNNSFLGPYLIDPEDNYTLTSNTVKLREKIYAGEKKSTLLVEGVLPDEPGKLLFSLNYENEESPVGYLAAQNSSGSAAVQISSISQVGNTVTVTTTQAHGAVASQSVLISGTTNFNGSWQVDTVPSGSVYTFTNPISGTFFENTGSSQPVVGTALSLLIMDSAYVFQNTQEVGTDITLLSDVVAYTPNPDGSDYNTYITGTAGGRVWAQDLIEQTTALGIKMEVVVIYPNGIGLGNYGESLDPNAVGPISDVLYVWGV